MNYLSYAKKSFLKWSSAHGPDSLVHVLTVRRSRIPDQPIFQEGFAAADPSKGALDIGANRGILSWAMSRRFPWVHSFEPNAELARFMRNTLPPHCTVHDCGLSDASGQSELALAVEDGVPIHGKARILSNAGDGYAIQPVRVETLDSFGLQDVGLIKIDVEGHEDKVLRGGIETLRKCRPVLIIEIEKRPGNNCLS